MKCYFAPMEGITGYVFRNAHHKYFGCIDRYYTPFIAPNQTRKLTSREMNDVLPEHNRGIDVVPQILTNKADDFLWAAQKVRELGYGEVNLNLGCPSGTVAAKGRGAGFLAFPEKLDRFLDTVSRELERMEMKLSVKTRAGRERPEEFAQLLEIFNRYPLELLTVHPRVQTDYYKNRPNLDIFAEAAGRSVNQVCYNGDIFSMEDFRRFRERFPEVEAVMLGRGLLTNPAMVKEIAASDVDGEGDLSGGGLDKKTLHAFHDELLEGYREAIPGDRNVLFKMKELWFYFGEAFDDSGKYMKKIRKAQRIEDYRAAVSSLFAERELAEHPRFIAR